MDHERRATARKVELPAVASLGLALATWIPQPGRVLAISVGTYIGITVGAIPTAILLFNASRPGSQAPCAAMMSPAIADSSERMPLIIPRLAPKITEMITTMATK